MWNPLYVLSELLGPEVCAKLGMVLCCLVIVGISVLIAPYVAHAVLNPWPVPQ